MSSLSAISVNDDLAACETCVTVRSADHELSCRVYMEDVVSLEESCGLRCESLDEHRQKDVLHVLADLRLHCLVNPLLAELSAAVSVAHLAQ